MNCCYQEIRSLKKGCEMTCYDGRKNEIFCGKTEGSAGGAAEGCRSKEAFGI